MANFNNDKLLCAAISNVKTTNFDVVEICLDDIKIYVQKMLMHQANKDRDGLVGDLCILQTRFAQVAEAEQKETKPSKSFRRKLEKVKLLKKKAYDIVWEEVN